MFAPPATLCRLFFVLGMMFFAGLPCLSFAEENSCINCHQQLTDLKHVGHNYTDWKKSIHATKGVTCQSCHGGNATATDPVKAHQGVLSSKDNNSSVYFQKIPATCGRCHTNEFQEFQKSIHYKTLNRTGRGPNCLTCHGAMATTVLSYADLDQTCSLCHGKPVKAAKAFSLLHTLKGSLKLYQKKLSELKAQASERFVKMEKDFVRRYNAVQKKWHSFNVDEVIYDAEGLIKEVKSAETELGKKPATK
ncbi:MAG: hypothetical protein A3H42_06850 [Deltaproteobacteria bacterium RIFCSPLOWO2_02_FULL_46_8]|nr:MAG: hypothetical protein A3H42_06850 [Deltaproteobacteria bacterium RIFCSPLOWO2_02_FULL_46_8]